MRCCILTIGLISAMFLSFALHTAESHPVTLDKAELLEIVPINDKDSTSSSEDAERNKRMVTIAMLRQLFPGLFQIIDAKVEDLVKYIVGIAGKAILQGGLFGGGGGGTSDSSSSSSDSSSSASSNGGPSIQSRGRVSITLPTFPPDPDDEEDSAAGDSASSGSQIVNSTVNADQKSDSENNLVGAESQRSEVKVAFNQPESGTKKPTEANEEESENNEEEEEDEEEETDQDASATGEHEKSLDPAHDDLSNLGEEEDRDKRFSLDASAGGSAGGSGNFLFDIIRLVAGSGSGSSGSNSEAADEAANGAIGFSGHVSAEGHNLDEPIPGPVTRLFVVANRSVANLVQDLILRLAQTSERFVNFKARLITSLI